MDGHENMHCNWSNPARSGQQLLYNGTISHIVTQHFQLVLRQRPKLPGDDGLHARPLFLGPVAFVAAVYRVGSCHFYGFM
jgi:hypothetical protein